MIIINSILLSITTIMLLGGGIYFSFKLGFPQIKIFKLSKSLFRKSENGIPAFKSLMLSLAARIGVGSLAGIALAIYLGGPGTIFWIWIIGIITSINSYCESYLGAKYQDKNNGGPSYYIEKGLKNKKLAIIYSLVVVVAYVIGFITIQANTINVSASNYYNLDKIIIAIILTVITFISIKGLNRIVEITSRLVPIMGISYIILIMIVVIKNIGMIPTIIPNIIKSAWNVKSFFSSFIPTFFIGMKRGVFSTEAGLGTGAIASSITHTNNKVSLGLIQILGIYFTVFIICTGTALIILTSNYSSIIFNNINGIELTQYALNFHLGRIGSLVLILSIILLAYSTIVAGYYYGESSLNYLLKNNKYNFILKIITTMLVFLGSIISANIIWKVVDTLVCILAIINMYSLISLRKEIIFDYKNSK